MKGSFLCQGKVLILMYIYFQLPAFPISIPIISYPDLTLSNLRQGDLVRYFLTKITLFFSKVRRQMSARGSSSLVWNHVDIEWSSCYGHSDRNNRHSFNRIRCRRALHIPVWHQGQFQFLVEARSERDYFRFSGVEERIVQLFFYWPLQEQVMMALSKKAKKKELETWHT